MKSSLLCLLLIFAAFLAGCAQNISSSNYNAAFAGEANKVIKGKIVNARPVQVSGNSGVGGIAGGVTGGAAGSLIGGSTQANIIGAVGGAVVGGLLGNYAEQNLNRQHAIEYIIKTRKGNLISIVQAPQPTLHIGQHVLVILGARARVIPDTEY